MDYKNSVNLLEFIHFQKRILRKYKNYIQKQMQTNYKKAALLVYWLNDYIDYIKSEENFNPKQNIKYIRGQIVLVNFGFRIGKELGGLHYAIVLDVHNANYESTLTVIPLKSNKNRQTRYHKIYTVILSSSIKTSLYDKGTSIINSNFQRLLEISRKMSEATSPNELNQLKSDADKIKRRTRLAQKILVFSDKLNNGSIADIGQITTISKQRIVQPCKKDDILFGVIANAEDMSLIERKIKYLYFST